MRKEQEQPDVEELEKEKSFWSNKKEVYLTSLIVFGSLGVGAYGMSYLVASSSRGVAVFASAFGVIAGGAGIAYAIKEAVNCALSAHKESELELRIKMSEQSRTQNDPAKEITKKDYRRLGEI